VNLLTKVAPQMVCQTGIASMAITQPLATRSIDRLIDRIDHLSNLDALHIAGQLIPASWPAHTGHQIAAAQLGEQLLKIGKGNALPLGNIGKRHWPMLRVQRQIEHGSYSVSALCSQSHGIYREVRNEAEYAIPEYLSQL
jgi:hypothetical protein